MIKANSLYKRRESLLRQKEIWEGATGFNEIEVLALGNIEKELKEVQAEFDEL